MLRGPAASLLRRSIASPGVHGLDVSARHFASKVAFVKKIYSDGSSCQKCDFVWKQIQKDGFTEKIDRTIVADERDQQSEGVVLARKHGISRAPFFIVTDDAKPDEEKVYDVYFKLKKEVFNTETGENEKNEEIIRGMMKQVF
mmetsp:Transcript_58777/g.108503  ORF Transcript_58777/g.108503 Transcript_58777/m.108503 type:complete len:143 (-) Transcript_58777:156-584(-)